jgi:hypothetical protein
MTQRTGYGLTAFLIAAAALLQPAEAQQRGTVFAWVCNLQGAPAQLVAQVEAISPAGIYMDANGFVTGAIPTNEVNYYYQGTLTSASARYVFTGVNQFADFTDLGNNERFRVQFIVQGAAMTLIANPFGPQPAQYLCQLSGPAR